MAFSSSDNNNKGLFTEINITPLTDIFFRPFIRTPRQGAATAIGLLLEEEAGKRTGTLNVSGHPKALSEKYLHHPQAKELWERTEQIVAKWM